MKIFNRMVFVLPALLLILLPAAQATTSQTASGSFTTNATTINVTVINGNTIITQALTVNLAGDLVGALTGNDVAVITSTGSGFLAGSGTFAGTILGRTGTVAAVFAGTFSPITGQLSLQALFLQGTGTGQLAGISGTGTVQGIFNVGGTYTFTVTFRS